MSTRYMSVTCYPPGPQQTKQAEFLNCDRCKKETPVPPQDVLNGLFGNGRDRVRPFQDWWPEGWTQSVDEDTTYRFCPECHHP